MRNYYADYIDILKGELIPALGCTEPIAIAYAASKAREVLGSFPQKIIAECSGNIIKNVKGVVVPTTGDMRGIKVSALIGAIGGDPSKKLEVLSSITKEHLKMCRDLLDSDICEQRLLDTQVKLHIKIHVFNGSDSVVVEIKDSHDNISSIVKNGEIIFENTSSEKEEKFLDLSKLNVEDIYNFATNVDIELIKNIFDRQIEYNSNISKEGLLNNYGANVGKTLLAVDGDDVKTRAKASASAASDARMSGCDMPVVINSGSGNQGITASLPVIEYAKQLKVSSDKLYRALALSNLIAIYQKSKIGRLSAYCGVVSAATGSGAGIAYLHDATIDEICNTITNTLGNVSGIICDGAKPSCAAKIASSVDAAIMGFFMAKKGNKFKSGEGLTKDSIEKTIDTISLMAKNGMKTTDEEILKLMIEE